MSRTTQLSPEEWKPFVLAEPARTGKLGTIRADGRPHVVPVWVAVDGDDIVFNAGDATAKVKAIRRDPRVSMCFDDERPPFSFVTIEGTATLSDDLEEVRRWATVIGGRYMGADRAEEYGARNGVPGELLVRVRPKRVIGEFDLAN
jgi:PPOX class probable F420-dependent enzyme